MPTKDQVLNYIQNRIDTGQSIYNAAKEAFDHYTDTPARSHSCLHDVLGSRAFYDFYMKDAAAQRQSVITGGDPGTAVDDEETTPEPQPPQMGGNGGTTDVYSMQFMTTSGVMKFGDMNRANLLSCAAYYTSQSTVLRRRARVVRTIAQELDDAEQTIRDKFTRAQAATRVKAINEAGSGN